MKLIKITAILAVAAFAVLAGGCKKDTGFRITSSAFEKKVTPGIYQVGRALYAMDRAEDQLYYNESTKTFMIVCGDGSQYIEIVLGAEIGGLGDMVPVTIRKTGNNFNEVPALQSVNFEILQKSGNNCWLWNQDSGIGILAFYVQ